jgi:hypothetical protein
LKEALLVWRKEVVCDPLVDPQYLREFVEHNRRESRKWSASPRDDRYTMDQERWIERWDPGGYRQDP